MGVVETGCQPWKQMDEAHRTRLVPRLKFDNRSLFTHSLVLSELWIYKRYAVGQTTISHPQHCEGVREGLTVEIYRSFPAEWPAAGLVDTILRFCRLPFELHWTEIS